MRIALIIVCLSISGLLNAQNLIAVEHNGISKFYSTLDSAVNAAQTGDNVYLPGGSYTISNPISKGIHIYGSGYNPDSSVATGITILSPLTLNPGADNGSIEGIYFTTDYYGGSMLFDCSNSSNVILNFTIGYCSLGRIDIVGSITGKACKSFLIRNNDIRSSNGNSIGGALQNSILQNNVIEGVANIDSNNVFSNNIFFGLKNAGGSGRDYSGASSSNCIYQNNIFQFQAGSESYVNSNSQFYNNINATPYSGYNNYGSGNISAPFDSTLFLNPGVKNYYYDTYYYFYDVHNNYHILITSSGKSAGTDGTDIGAYGGALPWKDGSMPSNPHIISKNIASTTSNGNLSVNIKVSAQKN